ncbi:hypothetical protein [Ruminococcus flavefaciens]|jgi:hypothetical protein|uniref:hypothetical protein n=1 Tax=Ruminococcus flavefaciens TaxID=1265 RepID=UPI00048E08C5|nr:hypothetical protein [Ruminococcus flavefaciens]
MTRRSAKQIYFTLVAALTASGFITVCTLGQAVRRHKTEVRLAAAAIEEGEPRFLVRESGGRIAVFRNGDEKPYLLLDMLPSLLSEQDREQLAEGLYFSSEQELRQFIEDISS